MGAFAFGITVEIVISVLIGIFASKKKRSFLGWFILSLIITPIIPFIVLLVIGPSKSSLQTCPQCAEEIKKEAVVCRYCGYKLPTIKQ